MERSEALEAMGVCETINITNVVVRDRVSVKRAVPFGLTVSEYRPVDAKASKEMEDLYHLAFGENGYSNGN